MQFDIPTSKTQMMETLREIYQYYNYRKIDYTGVELEDLALKKIEYVPPTDEQLIAQARTILLPDVTEEKTKALNQLSERLVELNEKYVNSTTMQSDLIAKIEDGANRAILELKKQAWDNNVTDSETLADKIQEVLVKKEDDILDVTREQVALRESILSEIEQKTQELTDLESYYEDLLDKKIMAKVIELKEKREDVAMEVLKYNNSCDEKIVKHSNSLKQGVATLELKYLAIHEQGFTHDELVTMGYYKDVLDCVGGYYNSIPAMDAYNDIKNNTELIVYVDDYYVSLVEVYKIKASQS